MNLVREQPWLAVAGAAVLVLLLISATRWVIQRWCAHAPAQGGAAKRHLVVELLRATTMPVALLGLAGAGFMIGRFGLFPGSMLVRLPWLPFVLEHAGAVGVFAGFSWGCFRTTAVFEVWLQDLASSTRSRADDVILPLLCTAARLFLPIVVGFALIQLWPAPAGMSEVIRQFRAVLLITALAWTLRRAIVLVDAAVMKAQEGSTGVDRRAIFTRVRMLRRIALVLVGGFAVAAVLTTFDEVRDVGRSILASAGIAGIVLGLAAQRSLGNLFAGLQIAFTQPIRLGDQVLVEGDVGNVEEITLTYVVVRVWDLRRIVLPITYFIEKPFQNWTRVTTQMLSPLTMRMDFTLPVDALREYLKSEISRSQFWDRKVFAVQVTNADQSSMEVRVLASAPDSGSSFNLQCELREKAIAFVRERYPEALPKVRQDQRRISETQHLAEKPLAEASRAREVR